MWMARIYCVSSVSLFLFVLGFCDLFGLFAVCSPVCFWNKERKEIGLDGWRGRNNLGGSWRKCDHNIMFERNLLLINMYITEAKTVFRYAGRPSMSIIVYECCYRSEWSLFSEIATFLLHSIPYFEAQGRKACCQSHACLLLFFELEYPCFPICLASSCCTLPSHSPSSSYFATSCSLPCFFCFQFRDIKWFTCKIVCIVVRVFYENDRSCSTLRVCGGVYLRLSCIMGNNNMHSHI